MTASYENRIWYVMFSVWSVVLFEVAKVATQAAVPAADVLYSATAPSVLWVASLVAYCAVNCAVPLPVNVFVVPLRASNSGPPSGSPPACG
jgi:hypothetical protein